MYWIQKESGPRIKVVPLPVQSQFLNVIESVFSGMKRAVIQNSDYGSEYEMKMAIVRYFRERNEFFKVNPKRAGKKIWDREHFELDKLESGLYKMIKWFNSDWLYPGRDRIYGIFYF